ncbi:Rhs element Vgr protein [Pseudomonas putida S16]|nr:Rhs element Vgr protein [Pseudomonas putida S16]
MPSQSDLRFTFQPLAGQIDFEVVSFELDEMISSLTWKWPYSASKAKVVANFGTSGSSFAAIWKMAHMPSPAPV